MLCFYYHSFLLFLLKIGIPNSSVGMMNPMMNSMMFGLGPGGQMPNSLHRSMHELRLGQPPSSQPTVPRGGGGGPPSPTNSQKSKKSTRSDRFAHRSNKQNSKHQRHPSNSDSRPASRPQSRNNSRAGGGHGHSRGPAGRHYRGSSRGRRRSISTEDEIDSDEVRTTYKTTHLSCNT